MNVNVCKVQSTEIAPRVILVYSSNSNPPSQKSPAFVFSVASGSHSPYSGLHRKPYVGFSIYVADATFSREGKKFTVSLSYHRAFQKANTGHLEQHPFLHLLLNLQVSS